MGSQQQGRGERVMETAPRHTMGDRMLRKEDGRFVRGKGNYVDDVQLPGRGDAAVVRSPHAPAHITRLLTDDALRIPGAMAV